MRVMLIVLAAAGFGVACSPQVKVQAPDKPITVNLNVKLEQEVRVKVDKELDDLIESEKDIF